jgi:hypothetical protein
MSLTSRWKAIRPQWKAILALVMVFAAGIAGGSLMEEIADDFDRPFAEADDDNGRPAASEENILANLDLTAEQRAAIERVFESREKRLEAYWDGQLPGLEAVIDSSRQEVRTILTPAQRTAYDTQLVHLRVHPRRGLQEDDDD